ncbi:MAG TPA: UbiD family decarboxylase, partial [Chloroflexota bacterium]|nr:UbiD family decarboxylase [Chloroflexota bacterium]
FMASHTKIPWGEGEYGVAGGLRGRPVEVIEGPITGLPIPAGAEIAIEGEIPPPSEEARDEGPFGEWPGYYSGGSIGTGRPQPVIRVKALYHRDNPLICNQAPMWPGALVHGIPISAGLLWDQLEAAGIQDIAGVFDYTSYFTVVAIRQRYAGHAKQVGHAVVACSASARNSRYVVVVDEDIDPTDMKEVLWAMETRVDPARDIETVDGTWGTPLDPRMPPDKKASGDHTNSQAIFYAVRPFQWKDRYPVVSRSPRELRREMIAKYRDMLPFPSGY